MSTPLRIQVGLPVEGVHILPGRESGDWPEDYAVTGVQWSAHRGIKGDDPIVSVTVFTARHHNQSWWLPSSSLAGDLSTAPPPEWVPEAPDWFMAVVEQMRDAAKAVSA